MNFFLVKEILLSQACVDIYVLEKPCVVNLWLQGTDTGAVTLKLDNTKDGFEIRGGVCNTPKMLYVSLLPQFWICKLYHACLATAMYEWKKDNINF